MSYSSGLMALLGKNVEVYCGQSRRNVKYSDYDVAEKTVVRGRLKEVLEDCIVVECNIMNAATSRIHSNDLYMNTWSITGVCVPSDSLSITDMFVDEGSSQPK